MTKKLLPLLALAIILFSSCGSDSENADINKEWTLIDINYSGVTSADGESINFVGQMVGGEATMQFAEDPNTVKSQGMYLIQLESEQEGNINLSRQELTFDQLGTWTRDGNTISTSAEGSFDADLLITRLTEDRMDLDFDYSLTLDFMGTPLMTAVKGTYFLASPEYIAGWKDQIKGGWVLTNAELKQYGGTFSSIDGLVDQLSIGTFSSGNAPMNFGDNGDFLASGFYNLDVETTDYDPFGPSTMSTSKLSNSFLTDGAYSISGRTITITEKGGNVRTFTIVDATENQLVITESLDGTPMGPFDLVDSRAQIMYTFESQIYVPVAPANIIGDWTLSDFSSDINFEVFLGSSLFAETSAVAELKSTTGSIVVSDNPNSITGSGSYDVQVTEISSGVENVKDETESIFSATNWIRTDNELQVFGSDFEGGSSTFTIESLSQAEMVLVESVDFSEESSGFTIKTSGTRTFTFAR